MPSHSPDELFSHPEIHDHRAAGGSPDPHQPSWSNLFLEPVPAQRAHASTGRRHEPHTS
ncbi:hypothetical protein [Lentzea sp. NPDC059081]|uniref:hypothetical protein n=1 Tax=Lentzea sp. NPDC059081 TaxID=3346719 RepID=UPI00368D768C